MLNTDKLFLPVTGKLACHRRAPTPGLGWGGMMATVLWATPRSTAG